MPANTPDQQITLPVGSDSADNPVAFTDAVADIEVRLVREYTNEADRTARMLSLSENDISTLGAEDRAEIYNGTNHISLYRRSLYAFMYKGANQILTQNVTTLQNVTDMSVSVPASGVFSFRGVLYYESSTVADMKFAFLLPAGAGLRWSGMGLATGAVATTGDATFSTVTASDSAIPFGGAGVGTVLAVQIEGEYVAGGTAGTFQLRAAQNTAELTNSTIIARSRIEFWRHA